MNGQLFVLNQFQPTRGHSMKFYKKQSNTILRNNFFTQRVNNCWNSLPEYVVSASNISLFKKTTRLLLGTRDMDMNKGLVPKLTFA